MHPHIHAAKTPDKPACIMGQSGEVVTYGQLEDRSNQIAQLYRSIGLKPGDTVAVFMDNNARYFEVMWAGQRTGLYTTAISSRLTAPEVDYILKDCNAKAFIASASLKDVAAEALKRNPKLSAYSVGGQIEGFADLVAARDAMPAARIADEMAGTDMLYSSGTTGRPKGVKVPLVPGAPIDADNPLRMIASAFGGFTEDTVYLSPAPLYHAAPLRWCMTAHKIGATVIVMEKFDPEGYLKLAERHKASASQLVPTMFVKMLKLPEDVRNKYDVSSLKFAIHAAAPCPVPVKQAMMDWWGPVIHEYYAGSEGNGLTWASPQDWLDNPGTVGRAILGELKICGEDGEVVPVGETGAVYFAGGPQFEYHNSPDKTADSRHPAHADWSTLGDVGYVNEGGFLFLTDRKAFMIISGGVNVYPQEIENLLITHPKVADVAVFGVPNEEFGEEVKAVVQPVNFAEAGDALAEELMALCKAELSRIKQPRSIDFEKELPRAPTGKLYKRLLRDRYWGKEGGRIV